jgi:Major Facilitator Superfamily
MNSVKKELLTVYLLSALFSGGRLFVGAISVLYVLSHGISIGEFATVKSVQVATFLIFDIPSGLLIKKIGYKNSLVITFVFSVFGLAFYIVGNSFTSFLVAEFMLAISLCICPAAFADYTMEFLNRNPQLLVEKFFHRNEMYTSMANVICGALGGYLYTFERTIPYIVGIFVQLIGLCLACKMINSNSSSIKTFQNTKVFLKNSLQGLKLFHASIALPIFLLFTIQLIIQPLYHYWQPLFYEINPQISGKILGLLFMSYSLCAIVLNYIFSKLVSYHFFRTIECVIFLLLISSGFYFLTALAKNEILAFFSFTCLQGLLFTALTCLSAIINRVIDNENRPVILKSISFLSRIGMLLSFGYIQIFALLEGKSEVNKEVHGLYLQASIILLGTVILVILVYQYLSSKLNLRATYESKPG